MVVDWVKDFDDRVQLEKQCGRGPCIFGFPQKNLRVLCEYFEHRREVLLEGCVADPAADHYSCPFRLAVVGSALENRDAGCHE